MTDLKRARFLTKDEEAQLAALRDAGDLSARNRLVEAVLPLVYGLARKWRGKGVDDEDLLGEANLLAVHAADKFDPARGRLTTIATMMVKQNMRRIIAHHGPFARLPITAGSAEFRGRFQRGHRTLAGVVDTRDMAGQPCDRHEEHQTLGREAARRLGQLPERMRQIVTRHLEGETLEQIGRSFGISKERVRQIESVAIARIKGGVAA